MIPTLLWQCPLCHVDDALKQRPHWFRPHEVRCTQCRTIWEVRRVIGSDYLLKVVDGDPSKIDWEQPLADWYDLMKAGLRLVPREAPLLPLAPGEDLYLQSRQAKLMAEEDNPLFDHWNREEAPSQKRGDLGLSFLKKWDTGRLSLSSERLIWVGERGRLTFQLTKANSVHTEVTWYLGLLYGLCRYKFSFREESILKWLTYIALVARTIEERHHHRISLSDY